MTISINETLRYVFWAIGFTTGCLFYSRWLLFSSNMITFKHKKARNVLNAVPVLTFLVSLLFVFSNNVEFRMTNFGVEFSYNNNLLLMTIIALLVIIVFTFLFMYYRWWRESIMKRDRIQALLFIILSTFIAPIGFAADFFIPAFTEHTVIPIASICFLPVSMPLFVFMRKYKTLSITVPNASGYVFDTVTIPTYVLDYKNNIKLENNASLDFFGRSVIDENIADLILSNGELLDQSFFNNAFSSEKVTVETPHGIKVCDALLSVEKDRYNDTLCKVVLLRDITENEHKDYLLEEALEEANSASKAKGDFLSKMSHEIRTPLNAVIGMIGIGMTTSDVDKMRYCFERADSASKHLLGIINDILDMSKIEADKFDLSYGEIDFEKMMIDISHVANVRAEEKHQNFIVNFYKNVPTHIESDELRLSQVITNFLTNAVKFTPESGTITINIENIGEADGHVTLRIEVTDTGIGISKEQQEKLFTSFNQADKNIVKKFGGTGLGLAISKRIIELMGGEVWIESELGKGASFIFTISVKKLPEKPRSKLLASINSEKIHVLAVDDAAETRNYFKRVMGIMNIPCDVASGGREALDMIQKSSDKPYNIFFIDWQMPEMDGIELTKRIKEINGNNSIVIMISVADWSRLEKEATEAGVKHFISKPLFPSELINAINICISNELNETGNESLHDEKGRRRFDFYEHTLLIAEDVDINREIMSAILDETGVSIVFAENGKLALTMFQENPDKYDLILMDVNMPVMDGYEATQGIRNLELMRAKSIPIIAMTANVFREDIEKCIDSGMNDHIGKPIDTDSLFGMLKKYLTDPEYNGKVKSIAHLKAGIAWNDDLLTGNTLVDIQHQRIFARVGELSQACEEGRDTDTLQSTIEILVNHTIRHFADEEALQLEHNYPHYIKHRKIHDDFKVTVSGIVDKYIKYGSTEELSNDVNKVIVGWLVNHIMNEDKKISDHIRDLK